MTVQVTDTLRDAFGEPIAGATIKAVTQQGGGFGTFKTAFNVYETDENGLYDFTLAIGEHNIFINYGVRLEYIAKVIVNSDTPSPTTLDELFKSSEPLTPSEIVEVREYMGRAEAAAVISEEQASIATGAANTATTKASEASASAASASESESIATTKASEASSSASQASDSATTASEQAAITTDKASEASNSASAAASSASAASDSQAAAALSESNASASATTASEQASIATDKASKSSDSASTAASSAAKATEQAQLATEAREGLDDVILVSTEIYSGTDAPLDTLGKDGDVFYYVNAS